MGKKGYASLVTSFISPERRGLCIVHRSVGRLVAVKPNTILASVFSPRFHSIALPPSFVLDTLKSLFSALFPNVRATMREFAPIRSYMSPTRDLTMLADTSDPRKLDPRF